MQFIGAFYALACYYVCIGLMGKQSTSKQTTAQRTDVKMHNEAAAFYPTSNVKPPKEKHIKTGF